MAFDLWPTECLMSRRYFGFLHFFYVLFCRIDYVRISLPTALNVTCIAWVTLLRGTVCYKCFMSIHGMENISSASISTVRTH